MRSSGGPSTTIFPPPSPASGPMSITQSAAAITVGEGFQKHDTGIPVPPTTITPWNSEPRADTDASTPQPATAATAKHGPPFFGRSLRLGLLGLWPQKGVRYGVLGARSWMVGWRAVDGVRISNGVALLGTQFDGESTPKTPHVAHFRTRTERMQDVCYDEYGQE